MAAITQSTQVRIEGRVQGVGYRAWTYRMARELGLRGWVRNRADGSVEALFQGPPDKVEHMLRACEVGPPGAAVVRVERIGEGAGVFEGFEVRPTA